MRELRQAIDPLGEHRIEAVNEQEDLAVSRRPERELSVQRLNERLVAVEIFFVAHDEIDIRDRRAASSPIRSRPACGSAGSRP